MNETITAVAGIEVGHWTDLEAGTGCTVVSLPEPNVVASEVRGGAPGTRETALLEPGMRVEQCQAILLTGGSAFGLAAADGVVSALESDGRGHETPVARVPIVPAAVIYDLSVDSPSRRPGPEEGRAAYAARSTEPVPLGRVGAGTGATAAKWRGFEHMVPGGVGSAVRKAGDATIGVLVVANPLGDVFTIDGQALTGGPHEPGPMDFSPPPPLTNSTLVVVATDARLTRVELTRVLVRTHDALAVCVRPAHTRYDGDVAFAVSCGDAEAGVDEVSEAAFGATAAAIEVAIRGAY
ncbi:MAG: P1 family peptidase [Acidimicrobiia bacterium]